ncbi:SMC family ATPase [Pseudonocardia ailaonensis]|uniref:Nuclease SbcCD subunit C n=1 Tax=Pseudonocardia ailaonensis TaxID=367279 RepID=A0ABN2MQW4_9PSEU
MRPVLLRMDGFGSFREPTTVDFADTDYFVLVGATGSGKSTVIDAMTFALYGSVPRWDDQRAVSLALAPTASRGTVSLEFAVDGRRYVAARELRRNASTGKVTVREARLEEIVGEDTTPLAAGREVTPHVERLLGLPFADFCTCVVLPQGDFADFLHAPTNERQQKLERILGMGIYDQIMRRANAEAATQRSRAELLTEQLGRYADATEEAEQRAAARVATVRELAARVDALLPRIAAADTDRAAAQALRDQLVAEHGLLVAVSTPDGVGSLDERRSRAAAAVDGARTAADEAEQRRIAATERAAAGPDAARLQQVRRDHADHGELTAARPALEGRRQVAEREHAAASAGTRAAEEAGERARIRADAAADALTVARETVERVVAELAALRRPTLPAGLYDLAGSLAEATAALGTARTASDAAEVAESAARSAVGTAAERADLERLRRDQQALVAARAAADRAAGEWEAARKSAEAGAVAAAEAGHLLHEHRARLTTAQRLDVAAALRPTLTAGDDCPVCAQTVATLPPPLAGTDLAGLEKAVAEAEAASRTAMQESGAAESAQATALRAAERARAAVAELESAVAGRPTDAEAQRLLTGLDDRSRAAETAADAARNARRDRDRAAARVDELRSALSGAEVALRRSRDPLVGLGAPDPGEDVAAGWRSLIAWAATEAADREKRIADLRTVVAGAETEEKVARRDLGAARATWSTARSAESAALTAEQQVLGEIEAADKRLQALAAALAGQPDDATAAAEITRAAELAAAAQAADLAARGARDTLRDTESAARAVEAGFTAAWDVVRRTRDPLVGLGAPALAGDDLAGAWAALTTWAAESAAQRVAHRTEAAAAAAKAAELRSVLEAELAEDLTQAGLLDDQADSDPPAAESTPTPRESALSVARNTQPRRVPGGPESAAALVAAALQEARGALARIVERRAEVSDLITERDGAATAHQVAKLLGDQLRSNHFPRWLVASALDVLVADASESLRELSGGQFELTHDNGDFLVVDHADADARRPVKTLSGGETFQASLALALALSSQLAGLAAEGAPRLESIFLDEGFGTLDESSLETVAGTLENLATRGDRMVGVITHVPALAERIPARFAVTRDQRTSTIVREGP